MAEDLAAKLTALELKVLELESTSAVSTGSIQVEEAIRIYQVSYFDILYISLFI